jgi:hypothetical protein
LLDYYKAFSDVVQDDFGVENGFSVSAGFHVRNQINHGGTRGTRGRTESVKIPVFPVFPVVYLDVTSMTVHFESATILSSALERKNK